MIEQATNKLVNQITGRNFFPSYSSNLYSDKLGDISTHEFFFSKSHVNRALGLKGFGENKYEMERYTEQLMQELENIITKVEKSSAKEIDNLKKEINQINVVIDDELSIIKKYIAYTSLGINQFDYMRLSSLAGNIQFRSFLPDGTTPFVKHGGKDELTEDEMGFIYSFCANTLIQIESQVGEIKDPYNS